jgi:hypothetical protein
MRRSFSSPTATTSAIALLFCLATAAACSSAGGDSPAAAGSGTGATGGAGGSAGTSGGAGTAGDAAACSASSTCSGSAQGATAVCVKTVDVTILSALGAPMVGFHAQVCGGNVCVGGKSDAQGTVHFAPCTNIKSPAFEIVGGPKYVSFAIGITASVTNLGTVKLVNLPTTGQPMPASPPSAATTLESGGVQLTLAAGTKIGIDLIDESEGDPPQFRAMVVQPSQAPEASLGSMGLELLVALGPFGATLSVQAKLSLPNSPQWAAGSVVEIFQQGLDNAGEGNRAPASWSAVGTGRVSADGKSIATDDGAGNGIANMALVGIRRKK